MQDNAAVPIAWYVKVLLEDTKIAELSCPVLSHNMNPIKNIWGAQIRDV